MHYESGLRNQTVLPTYGPGAPSPIRFYSEILPASSRVRLGLGYFASTAFEVLARSFTWWSDNVPKFQIVANDQIAPADVEVLRSISNSRNSSVCDLDSNAFRSFWDALGTHKRAGYEFLRYLLDVGQVELKIALAPNGGIVHHKFAVFEDSEGDKVVTFGSMNFSAHAFLRNVETLHAATSWVQTEYSAQLMDYYVKLFERLWADEEPSVQVISGESVGEVLRAALPRRNRDYFKQTSDTEVASVEGDQAGSGQANTVGEIGPSLDPILSPLRDYQREAIYYWQRNGFRGLWAMATGTGKTLTALRGVKYLKDTKRLDRMMVVVIVPSTALVEQWAAQLSRDEAYLFVIKAVGAVANWSAMLARAMNYAANREAFVAVVATHGAFKSHISRRIQEPSVPTLLIVDEVHTMGTEAGLRSLPNGVNWRLALSATPIRQYDSEGTKRLLRYFEAFSKPFYAYTLEQAVSDRYLSPYQYHVDFVELAEEEWTKYTELTDKIVTMINSDDPEIQRTCNQLLIKRHRIVERARNKLEPATRRILELNNGCDGSCYGIIYSPDGPFPAESAVEEGEWLEKLLHALGSEGVRLHRFVQGDDKALMDHLANGHLDWLVAKKRLDEGVDIPRAEIAVIVASSRTLRQYIQRRGRVLRPHPNKSQARIFDYVVLPFGQDFSGTGRALVRQELSRAAQFAQAAINKDSTFNLLMDLAEVYGVEADELRELSSDEESILYESEED